MEPAEQERPITPDLVPSVIQVVNLCKYIAVTAVKACVLHSIDFSVRRGDFVAIMGPSGSGKTTLMNILGCLDRPTTGKYFLNNVDVGVLDHDQLADLRNLQIGFVFQSFNLLSRTTAIENVELPLVCGTKRKHLSSTATLAMERLVQVGLRARATHFPDQLSGGQQQRVAIARALVNDPAIILADEPTGNLDSKMSLEIMKIFQELNDAGQTIIMVTHEWYMARFCKRVLVIKDGLLVRDEPVKDRLRADEELAKVREDDPLDLVMPSV
jgi:putative ABC transport system ATP-binding protein